MLKSCLFLPIMCCVIFCHYTKQEKENSYLLRTQEFVYFSKDYKRVARHVEPDKGNVLFYIIKQLKRNYPGSKYLNSKQSMPKIISMLKSKLKKHYHEKKKVQEIKM